MMSRTLAVRNLRRALTSTPVPRAKARVNKPIVPGHNAPDAAPSSGGAAAAADKPRSTGKIAPSLFGRREEIVEDAWRDSEERTQSIRETEKWAVITFVVTAPFAYGIFWYAGVFDDPAQSFSRTRKTAPERGSTADEARARVDAALAGTPPVAAAVVAGASDSD
tara:strand:+ start:502 stop:996 length:495 start_codon:yes stop_codon:yes gene_type:complete